MGTERKNNAAGRRRSAGVTRFAAPAEAAAHGEHAAAAQAVATTVVRRFRRGRWTLTAVPV